MRGADNAGMGPIVVQGWRHAAGGVVVALGLAACAPALDWRQVEPEGARLSAMYPCKPRSHERTVQLAGSQVRMRMYACQAAGLTFALTYADLPDPAHLGPALRELRQAAVSNLGGEAEALPAPQVPGMTPQPDAAHVRVRARRPEGGEILQESVFFARGMRVYQASVVGERLPEEAVETFLGALKAR